MKKLLCLVLALMMVLALCACGAKEEAPTGSYTYSENNGAMDITWTLTLNADGTMLLGEVNELFPEGESYAGNYTVDGGVVSCTFSDATPNVYIWAAPEGFTATLNGTTFSPTIPDGATLTTNEMASGEPAA